MISRILLPLLTTAVVLTSTAVFAQSECPKEEIIIFGSAYGYTTTICNKSGKDCTQAPSATIVFYQNKLTKVGCGKAPNCNTCVAGQPDAKAKAGGNFVYGGRQIFLDTTNGISKIDNLEFAMVEGDKSDTHYAVFEIAVAYNQKGKDPVYFACPIALQLPSDPKIPNPLKAANKTVEGESHLVVTDAKSKEETSYKIVVSEGNRGVVKSKLVRTLDKNPIPAAAAQPAATAKPTPARRPRRKAPEEDK